LGIPAYRQADTPNPFFIFSKQKNQIFFSNRKYLVQLKRDNKFTSHNTAHAVQKFCAIIFQGVQNFLSQIALTKWQV